MAIPFLKFLKRAVKRETFDDRYDLDKTEWTKGIELVDGMLYKREYKMKEKVEMPNKSTVLAVARKCPDAKDVLKGLFPEAFEEEKKEIKLEDGQIYKYRTSFTYYVLHRHETEWKLMDIKSPSFYWGGWQTGDRIKQYIQKDFTLCPHATITVNESGRCYIDDC